MPKTRKNARNRHRVDVSSSSVSSEMNQHFGGSGFGGQLSSLFEGVNLPESCSEKEGSELESLSGTNQSGNSVTIHSAFDALESKHQLKLGVTRAGRGGKIVTTLKMSPNSSFESKSALAKMIGRALGCRAWVEDGVMITQGDQRERIKRWVNEQI